MNKIRNKFYARAEEIKKEYDENPNIIKIAADCRQLTHQARGYVGDGLIVEFQDSVLERIANKNRGR